MHLAGKALLMCCQCLTYALLGLAMPTRQACVWMADGSQAHHKQGPEQSLVAGEGLKGK